MQKIICNNCNNPDPCIAQCADTHETSYNRRICPLGHSYVANWIKCPDTKFISKESVSKSSNDMELYLIDTKGGSVTEFNNIAALEEYLITSTYSMADIFGEGSYVKIVEGKSLKLTMACKDDPTDSKDDF